MAGAATILDDAEQRARWSAFAWTDENARQAQEIIARYPEGRQVSAVIPLARPRAAAGGRGDEHAGVAADPGDGVRRARARHLVHPRARSRDLLHDVQPRAGRPLPRAGVRDDAVHAARLRRRLHRLRQARAEEGKNDRGRAFHSDRGRMPRRLRQRADGADQRRQLRGPRRGAHGRDPRRAGARRDAAAGPADRPPDELPRRRPDHAQEDGRAQLRLPPDVDGDGRSGEGGGSDGLNVHPAKAGTPLSVHTKARRKKGKPRGVAACFALPSFFVPSCDKFLDCFAGVAMPGEVP